MKIKCDFVTNSSSSSFVALGSFIDPTTIEDKYFQKLIDEKYQNLAIEQLKSNASEYIDVMLQGSDLTYSFGYDYGDMMVGGCYTTMGENETMGQFRKKIKDQFKKHLGIDIEPIHIEECWMDN